MSEQQQGGRSGHRWRPPGVLALLLAGVVLVGCDNEEEYPPPATNGGALEGVPREEIPAQAEPMSLEEAERLGIVDTTIKIGVPVGPDSMVFPATPPPAPGDSAPPAP